MKAIKRPLQIAWLILFVAALTLPSASAAKPSSVPPPLRVFIPFEAAWNGMKEVLEDQKWTLVQEIRGQGLMLTDRREYSSGPLTESHIAKIGDQPKLTDAYWQKVEYEYEVQIELIGAKETLVTVNANIRALKRDFFGRETWIDIPTNGQREALLLDTFGKRLFGETFRLEEPRKGFWERDPVYLPSEPERVVPKVPGPERP